MRNVLIIFTILATAMMVGCAKEENKTATFESTGMIMGSDKGACPCCGGWILEIDNDSNLYRIEELPDGSGIELNEVSHSVQFNWSINRVCGSIIYLDIEEIELY